MEVADIDLSDNEFAWLEMAEQRFEAMQKGEAPGIPDNEFFSLVESD